MNRSFRVHFINLKSNILIGWILCFTISMNTSCNIKNESKDNPVDNSSTKIQKTVEELVDEHNKELLTRKYDLDLKTEEIEFFMAAYKTGQNRYPKEWRGKVINETHVEIENDLRDKSLKAESIINKYKTELDSLSNEGIIDNQKSRRINKLLNDLEKLKNDNLNYIKKIN